MEKFNISRINTEQGIFRIAGFWHAQSADITANITVNSIAIMGTDGWVELNRNDDKIIKLINGLAKVLHQHLLAKVKSA